MLYQVLSSSALLSLGLYHLIPITCNYLHTTTQPNLPLVPYRKLQLCLIIISFLVAITHQLILSAESGPLLKGATHVHRFTSLQSVALLFLILTLSLLFSDFFPLPHDLSFALASILFLVHSSITTKLKSPSPKLIPKPPYQYPNPHP